LEKENKNSSIILTFLLSEVTTGVETLFTATGSLLTLREGLLKHQIQPTKKRKKKVENIR